VRFASELLKFDPHGGLVSSAFCAIQKRLAALHEIAHGRTNSLDGNCQKLFLLQRQISSEKSVRFTFASRVKHPKCVTVLDRRRSIRLDIPVSYSHSFCFEAGFAQELKLFKVCAYTKMHRGCGRLLMVVLSSEDEFIFARSTIRQPAGSVIDAFPTAYVCRGLAEVLRLAE
jgi:hypothetical protein